LFKIVKRYIIPYTTTSLHFFYMYQKFAYS